MQQSLKEVPRFQRVNDSFYVSLVHFYARYIVLTMYMDVS
jgi:hypothetical protein